MALRNNKAARFNRFMMFGMFFLGILVIGCVFAFIYLSYNKDGNPLKQQSDNANDSLKRQQTTVIVEVEDQATADSLNALQEDM